jgi:hypothetical protein
MTKTHTQTRQAGKAKSPLLGGLVRFASCGLSRWLGLGRLGRGRCAQESPRNVVHGEGRGLITFGLSGIGHHVGPVLLRV